MPSEPIEAELVFPPALTREQEDQLRELEIEGLIVIERPSTRHSHFSSPPTINQLEQTYTKEGFHIVKFDKGTGEDPREWSRFQKWYVYAGFCLRLFV